MCIRRHRLAMVIGQLQRGATARLHLLSPTAVKSYSHFNSVHA